MLKKSFLYQDFMNIEKTLLLAESDKNRTDRYAGLIGGIVGRSIGVAKSVREVVYRIDSGSFYGLVVSNPCLEFGDFSSCPLPPDVVARGGSLYAVHYAVENGLPVLAMLPESTNCDFIRDVEADFDWLGVRAREDLVRVVRSTFNI